MSLISMRLEQYWPCSNCWTCQSYSRFRLSSSWRCRASAFKGAETKPATDQEFEAHSIEFVWRGKLSRVPKCKTNSRKKSEKDHGISKFDNHFKAFLDFKAHQDMSSVWHLLSLLCLTLCFSSPCGISLGLGTLRFEIQKCRNSNQETDFCKFSWLAYRFCKASQTALTALTILQIWTVVFPHHDQKVLEKSAELSQNCKLSSRSPAQWQVSFSCPPWPGRSYKNA